MDETTPGRVALRTAGGYAVVGALWILGSDLALTTVVRDGDALRWASMYKGWAFVGVTAGLLYLSVRAQVRRVADQHAQRQEAEQRAVEAAERFHRLAETVGDVVWSFSADLTAVRYVSPAFERVWGTPRAALDREPLGWLSAVGTDHRESVLATLRSPTPADCEFPLTRPDGDVRWVGLRTWPERGPDGVVRSVAALATDVTERRRLEAELVRAQKLEALGLLASGVAHDFNNLLTVVLANASLLRAGRPPDDDVRELATEVQRAAERAAGLTRQLLLYTRRDATTLRPVDLPALVRDLAKLLRRLLREDLDLALDVSTPLLVQGDAGMLEQVLVNLIVNARDAMPRGGTLRTTVRAQTLDADEAARRGGDARAGSWVVLSVTDTGTGIPADVLPHLFEAFFTTKEPGRGTGLGLSTVHRIVQRHGGWIEVRTRVGAGSTFDVYLPEATGQADDAGATSGELAVPPAVRGRVVVVEDDPGLRRAMEALLRRRGHEVAGFATADEALGAWPRLRETVDVLVSDVVLPGTLSGPELADRLRADRPRLPVVLTSGHGDAPVPGAEVLAKPFDAPTLAAAVERALGSRPPDPPPGPR